ncbi:hypothetical protein Lesp02_49480 [Lentzea sp. NBRC 105346]|uniref:Uma2 family endonuclease n=1 Tax=Lentzea sp. NBRC 105346 TaxID=3032205 RepID=UPI0024A37C3F|nr:Uma2 family endonuclease [Lentzea sp. NBRC 105346]GLZ32760.1 hypothetical protein Lesp02_49480 [Lentzea sp. NBRC 105346]
MTALPEPPSHLLTVAEYAALGETEPGYTELQEGRILMSPSPTPEHNIASGELYVQLRAQAPDDFVVIQDIDIDLELTPADHPGFSRRPDMVVVSRAERQRVRKEGGILRASEVILVVEIVSPGSRRTDYMIKRDEYADARIPHYWIVDISEPVSLHALHHAGDFGYQETPAVTAEYSAIEPFPVKIQVDQLSERD